MMAKFSTSDDIYRELVEESNESWLYGLVAFAIIEEQRIEWARHHEQINGTRPTTAEIESWYEQQPKGVLLRAKGTAENALQVFSEEVVASELEEHGKGIEEGIIIGEIRSLGRLWPQFGVNVAAGLVSALLFATLLVVIAFLVLNDVSPVQIGDNLREKVEVTGNGHKQKSHE